MRIGIFQTLAMLIPTFILIYVVFAIVNPLLNDLLEPTISGSLLSSTSILLFDLVILSIGMLPIILISLALSPEPKRNMSQGF